MLHCTLLQECVFVRMKVRTVVTMLKAIPAQDDKDAALEMVDDVFENLREMRLRLSKKL